MKQYAPIIGKFKKAPKKRLTTPRKGAIISSIHPNEGRGTEVSAVRKKLQTLREATGLNQSDFGKLVGISRSHYGQIETGEKDPSLKVSLRIKRTLKYQNDDLFFNQKSPVTRQSG